MAKQTKQAKKAKANSFTRKVRTAAKAVAARMPRIGARPDAIDLLENEHRRLEALLDAGEKTTERAVKRRATILKSLTDQLKAHELIEEKVLYPALKPYAKAKDIVLEGFQEHHVADVVLKELKALRPSDERWGAKFKVLKENIEHHIEEEEGEMFKTARTVLSGDELRTFRAKMLALRKTRSKKGTKKGTKKR